MSKTQEESNSTREAECVEPLTEQKSLSCLSRFLLQMIAHVTRVSQFKINAFPKAQARKLLYYGVLSMSSAITQTLSKQSLIIRYLNFF